MINLWFTNETDNGIITSKGTTAHKGLTNEKDSKATQALAKVFGWLLLCRITYKT